MDAHTHCYSVQVNWLSVYIYVEQHVRKRDTKFCYSTTAEKCYSYLITVVYKIYPTLHAWILSDNNNILYTRHVISTDNKIQRATSNDLSFISLIMFTNTELTSLYWYVHEYTLYQTEIKPYEIVTQKEVEWKTVCATKLPVLLAEWNRLQKHLYWWTINTLLQPDTEWRMLVGHLCCWPNALQTDLFEQASRC